MAATSLATSNYIGIPEIASTLGVGTSWLYERIRKGEFELPVLRVGKQLRVSRVAFERILAQAEVDSTSQAA